MLKNDLHPDIINFCKKSFGQMKKKELPTTGDSVIVHYIGKPDEIGYPNLSEVVAFEYHDGEIKYRWNNKNYSENEMLRMINLKAFI